MTTPPWVGVFPLTNVPLVKMSFVNWDSLSPFKTDSGVGEDSIFSEVVVDISSSGKEAMGTVGRVGRVSSSCFVEAWGNGVLGSGSDGSIRLVVGISVDS